MSHDLIIAELLCTRLCHDITGPIGAVNNGVEFLAEEEGDMQGQAVELIMSSAHEAVSRLQFYRYAYGKINDQTESGLEDKKKLVTDFFAGSKITLHWNESNAAGGPATLNGAMTRLLFNMLIIASSTLLKGGALQIDIHCGDDERRVAVSASGAMVKWEAEAANALDGKLSVDALSPKTVQYYMTQSLARTVGVKLNADASGEQFNIQALETIAQHAEAV